MDTICLQCGDKGCENAFVYCVRCLGFAVHRYCLDVIPVTFDEFVPWRCEDCELKEQKQSVVQKHDAGPSLKKNDILVTEEHVCKDGIEGSYNAGKKLDLNGNKESTSGCSPAQSGDINDEHAIPSAVDKRKRCQQNSSQQFEEGKVKDNLMELVELSDDSSPKEDMKRNASKHAKLSDDVSPKEDKKRNKRKHAKLSDDISLKEDNKRKRVKVSDDMPLREYMKISRRKRRLSKQSHKGSTKLDISKRTRVVKDTKRSPKLKENKGTGKRDEMSIPVKPCDSNADPGTAEYPTATCNESLKSSMKKRIVTMSGAIMPEQMPRISSAQPPRENNLCEEYPKDLDASLAEPVVTPIWRGSFNIWSKKHDMLEGLVAHMSSQACRKVYLAACQFQPVIHLEMLPRSAVWPKSFKKTEPGGDNIALYFFPSKISEHDYDNLVEEMMCEELALRVYVKNAELLIFTSTELPLLYWRFQGKHYLWGVFREKQSTSKDTPNDIGFNRCEAPVTMKNSGAPSPIISPLINSANYGSATS